MKRKGQSERSWRQLKARWMELKARWIIQGGWPTRPTPLTFPRVPRGRVLKEACRRGERGGAPKRPSNTDTLGRGMAHLEQLSRKTHSPQRSKNQERHSTTGPGRPSAPGPPRYSKSAPRRTFRGVASCHVLLGHIADKQIVVVTGFVSTRDFAMLINGLSLQGNIVVVTASSTPRRPPGPLLAKVATRHI